MDGATLATHFSQAEWDLVIQSLPSSPPARIQQQVPTDTWLRLQHDLTADIPTRRPLPQVEDQPVADECATEPDVTSSNAALPASAYTVPQQLLPYISKYNFETCRSTYFEFSSEPSTAQKGKITPSKYQKGLTCDFPPDYKCKVSPFPVVTTCSTFPADCLCGRCGSIGDHTMIHCLGCCQAYHAFCAHLPESLVHSLTSWYCHRCAECRHCHEKEVFGKKFASDIIETCHRCHSQYHVHCEKINHFLVVCRESSKQTKICQRCFFQSNCRGCRARISPEDILRECIGMNGEACSVCRHTEEWDLCRKCLTLHHDEELKQVVCDICKDSTHVKCLRDTDLHRLSISTGRFICCDCQKNVISMKKEEVWTEKSALQIIDRLRHDVLVYINDSLDKPRVPTTVLSHLESVDSPPASELDSEQLSSDSGFQSNGDTEGAAGLSREGSDVLNVPLEVPSSIELSPRQKKSIRPSVAVQTTSTGPLARHSRPLSSFEDDTSVLVQSLSLTSADVPDPVFLLEGRVVPVQPEVLPPPRKDFSSVAEELSILLRELLVIRNEKEVCLWPMTFTQAIEVALSKTDLPVVLNQTLRSHFSDMCGRLTLPKEEAFQVGRMKRRSLPVGTIFPIVHRGDEPLILLSGASEQSSTAEERRKSVTADQRLCMYCTVAGDDNVGYGGRILSVGYDLWAHIGCLNYVATKKRYFDYVVFKVTNIDSLRKNECASCPVRMGVITCAISNCRNAYHFNCAINEKCSLTATNGVVCTIHKHAIDEVTDIRLLRVNDLEESFTNLPVFVKAPPSNIRSVGKCDWTSGIRKDDVKVYVGGVHVEQLGRLVRGWDTQETLLPCGYKMHRLFWSTKDPRLLTRHTFFTMDMNQSPELKALICSILEREDIPGSFFIPWKKDECYEI
ncbi:hypothetical protein RvY_07128-2 [Ramazzottius varieornatus]|uniref:PHD-type domain-containing protein n=1 Tax=Ramazzottius varieornatus TaxID=947166 RepID=A0A1D1V780_RAMVA|nr:hypothetical protein RvY_07128-2 [Ramazzottius varieornatus]